MQRISVQFELFTAGKKYGFFKKNCKELLHCKAFVLTYYFVCVFPLQLSYMLHSGYRYFFYSYLIGNICPYTFPVALSSRYHSDCEGYVSRHKPG